MQHHYSEPSWIEPIATLLPGFDFQGLIAQGARGTVYRARQRSLDREVAIRIAPQGYGCDPSFRNSFKSMVKAMGGLAHPGIIRIYDSGEVEGLPFVVMEYVAGNSLSGSAQGKAVDPRQAAKIVMATCQGLAHAHGEGIAHGAIRPANILLTPQFEPKLGNFGFNLQCPHEATDADAYIAPELANGSAASPRSDVYSIGVVLQELLTGIPAGTATAAGVVLPDAKLASICEKAVHPDPTQRYPDAGSLADSLGQWLTARAPLRTPNPRQPSPARPKAPVAARPHAIARPASRASGSAGRGLMLNCALIAGLLVAIHGLRGVYQEKQESLTRLRSMQQEKPGMIILNHESGKESPHVIDPSIVQLKP